MQTSKLACESLESPLQEDLDALGKRDSYVHNWAYIFKVSEKYRNIKEDSYKPPVVSIGPLHHGKSHLRAMEGYKVRCLYKLLSEFKNINLKKLSGFATSQESLIGACYQDFTAKEFSKMILLDGIFLITLFVQNDRTKKVAKEASKTLSHYSWIASDVKHDMLLVENQLPFSFMKTY